MFGPKFVVLDVREIYTVEIDASKTFQNFLS